MNWGAWDGLRYFIVALPEPSINYYEVFFKKVVVRVFIILFCGSCYVMKAVSRLYIHIIIFFKVKTLNP